MDDLITKTDKIDNLVIKMYLDRQHTTEKDRHCVVVVDSCGKTFSKVEKTRKCENKFDGSLETIRWGNSYLKQLIAEGTIAPNGYRASELHLFITNKVVYTWLVQDKNIPDTYIDLADEVMDSIWGNDINVYYNSRNKATNANKPQNIVKEKLLSTMDLFK